MPMTTLRGYTVDIFTDNIQHTYVASDDGHRWGCTGRSSGGREICSGAGDSDQADCISKHDAGIIYGFTGVCHQIANRILFPAGSIKVSDAGGYLLSKAAYGDYGHDPPFGGSHSKWKYLRKHCTGHTEMIATATGSGSGMYDIALKYSGDERRLGMAMDLYTLFYDRLGRDYDADHFQSALQGKFRFWDMKDKLDLSLTNGAIDPMAYANKVNEEFGNFAHGIAGIIGDKDYRQLFNMPVRSGLVLVVPETMARIGLSAIII